MNKLKSTFLFLSCIIIIGCLLYISTIFLFKQPHNQLNSLVENAVEKIVTQLHPLSVQKLREGTYPGSDIKIEEKLKPGSNYERYLTSYQSEGLKIYALLTIPNNTKSQPKPSTGWPVIVFNHGYIPPDQYKTTERYIAYTDAFSRNGYIVFRPDYRGHGDSEGEAMGGYGSNAYTIDVLNAVSSIQKHKDADASRIGMWGHSMGGFITLRSLVVNKDIKAADIWAGVVGSYPDLINNWRRSTSAPPVTTSSTTRRWRQTLASENGTPEENPEFWNSLSANTYLSEISAPIQLQHGTADADVPVEFSENLYKNLKAAGKNSEIFIYPGDNHNLSQNLSTALKRSVSFFDTYLKK